LKFPFSKSLWCAIQEISVFMCQKLIGKCRE
jgi:hypothetical protein